MVSNTIFNQTECVWECDTKWMPSFEIRLSNAQMICTTCNVVMCNVMYIVYLTNYKCWCQTIDSTFSILHLSDFASHYTTVHCREKRGPRSTRVKPICNVSWWCLYRTPLARLYELMNSESFGKLKMCISTELIISSIVVLLTSTLLLAMLLW